MRNVRAIVALMLAGSVAAGCGPAGQPTGQAAPTTPVATTATPSAQPTASPTAAGPDYTAITTARCAKGSLDLASASAQIAAVKRLYPQVTDDRAAYALSLLPPDVVAAAGLKSVHLGHKSGMADAYLDGTALAIKPSAGAPAQLAALIMFALAVNAEDADSGRFQPVTVVKIAHAIEYDTYLRIAVDHPEALQGTTIDATVSDGAFSRVYDVTDQSTGTQSVSKTIFKPAPKFWSVVAAYMGRDYYRDDPDHAGSYQLHYPATLTDGATLMASLDAEC
jgi:hypothetical protein